MMKEDWVECTLGEICENALKVKRQEMPLSKEIKYLDIGGIDNHLNKIVSHKDYTWKDAPSRAQQIIKKGDILFSTVRTYLKNIAKVNKEEYSNEICSSGFTVLRAQKEILDEDFLFFLTLSTDFLNSLSKLQTGTSYPAVRDKDVFSQTIPLPPLPIQRAIVAKIEELFSSLDSGIADLKKAQEQLVIYRQAVLKKAFEGELTKEWREKNKIIFNWEKTTTGEVMPDISSGSTPKAEFLFKEGDIQFLKVYNLNFDGTLNESKDPAFTTYKIHTTANRRAITKAGDVLINIVGPPLGKCSMIPLNCKVEFNINQAIVRFRPNDKILPKFLSCFLQNPETINWLEGTSKATAGQFNIKVTTCRIIPISLPTLKEQHQIVREIESRLSVCDKVEESITESLVKAIALRQSILKKAFEGNLLSKEEVAKCKQEKDYEPASVLLERIKAEKKQK